MLLLLLFRNELKTSFALHVFVGDDVKSSTGIELVRDIVLDVASKLDHGGVVISGISFELN